MILNSTKSTCNYELVKWLYENSCCKHYELDDALFNRKGS